MVCPSAWSAAWCWWGYLSKRTDYVAKWIWSGWDVTQQGSCLWSQPKPKRDAKWLIPLCAGDFRGAAATSWISASSYRFLFLYRPVDSECRRHVKGGFACLEAGCCTQAVQGPKAARSELTLLHHLRDEISTDMTWTSWCWWRGPLVPRDQFTAVEQPGCWLPPSLTWNSSSPNRASQENLAVSMLVK